MSHKILYLDIKSQEHMFTMVNAMVSHELRNPLTSLLAQLEQQAKIKAQLNKFIADLRTAADAQQQYALPRVIAKLQTFEQDLTTTNKKIQQSSKFINYFIHDILDFSILRDGGHKFVKHESVFDVKDAVHEIVDILHDKAVMKNIAVDTQFVGFPASLHNSSLHACTYVKTDAKRLQQVLLNLVSNALKYTDRDGHIDIVAQYVPQPNSQPTLSISVQDDGLGIRAEDQGKLFKMFSSVIDLEKGINTHGIGLGLVICRMIVEQFGGQIDFVSEYNVGSRFFYDIELSSYAVADIPSC